MTDYSLKTNKITFLTSFTFLTSLIYFMSNQLLINLVLKDKIPVENILFPAHNTQQNTIICDLDQINSKYCLFVHNGIAAAMLVWMLCHILMKWHAFWLLFKIPDISWIIRHF